MPEYTHIETHPSLERGRLDIEGGKRAGSREVEIEWLRVGWERKMNKNNNKVQMPFESVPCQKCNGIVTCCKNLTHLTHLIKFRFCVWCAKCAKYLAFDTFDTSAIDA